VKVQTIYGRVSSDGSIHTGTGFTATKLSAGHYKISFPVAFKQPPAVVATQNNYHAFDANQKTIDNVIVGGIKTNECRIKTGNSLGNVEDREFAFIAIGAQDS